MAKKKFIPRPKESERVIRKRWTKKRDSIENLSNNVQKLRYNVSLGLKNESKNEKNFLTCLVIAIMDKSFERVGNEASAANGKVGITGLNKDQVTIIGNKIILEYTGKSGVEHEKMFSDAKIAKALKIAKKNSPDENVFTTSKGFKIRNNRINRYLSDFGILSKNLRGYGANNLLVKKLSELEPEETEAKRKVQFNKVARFVAKKVGHGLPTLKKHYMIPEIEPNFIEFSKVIEIDDVSKFNDGGTIKAEEKTKKTKPSENPNVDKFTCEDAIPDSKLKKSLPQEIEDILEKDNSSFKEGGGVVKPKIVVHNNTDSASDKDAQKIIINYLKNINESGHKKFFEFLKKSNQNINDYEAVFYLSKDYYDKNVGKYYSNKIIYQKNVSDAYQNALNYDDAYPNFIRIYKHGNIKGFAATTEFDLFGDWEGDKYDDNGRLKQELKEQAIQQLKKDLYVTNNQNSGEYKMKEGGDIKNLGNDILPIGSIISVQEFRSYHKYEVVGFVEKREGSGIRYDVYELKADMSGVKGKKTQITFPYPNTKTKFRYNATIPKEGSKLISQSEIDSEKRRGSESEVVIKWEGNKPSYLMTKEEYKSIVTPKMKEFNKFISKNKEYFSKKDYYGIDYLDFESFKSIHEPSQYSTVERDFLQRSKTSEGTVPKQADEKLIKELNEYKDYFANIFGRENIKKIEDDEVGNNKRSIRRAIDSGVYEKLLREGKINYTFLKTVFDSVGINIPTKLEKIESEVVDKGITSDVQISLKEKTENFFSNLKRLFEKEIRFYADTFKEHYIESIKRMKNFCDRHKEFVNYDTFAYNYSINNNYQPTPIYENVRGIQKLKGYNYHPDIQKLYFLNKIFENSSSNESVRFFIADNWEELLEVRALDYANDLFKNFGRRILQETEVINSIDKNFPEIQNARVLRLTEKGFEANFDLKYPNGFIFSVETQVIYAGGYNIQALHLRGLFKFQYKGKFISEKELIEAYNSFSGEEKTIEKGSLIINEISIPENIDVLLKEKYTLNKDSDFYSSELMKLAGESGLVSEEVRKSNEYIRLNVKSKISFKKLQEFNESEKNKTIDDFVRKLDRVTQQKIRSHYSEEITKFEKGGEFHEWTLVIKNNETGEKFTENAVGRDINEAINNYDAQHTSILETGKYEVVSHKKGNKTVAKYSEGGEVDDDKKEGGRYSFKNDFGSFTSVFVYVPIKDKKEFLVEVTVRRKNTDGNTELKVNSKWMPIEKYDSFIEDLKERQRLSEIDKKEDGGEFESCVLQIKAKMSEGGELTIDRKKVYEGDKKLRDMSLDDVEKYIGIYHEKDGNMFFAKNKFIIWFYDTTDFANKINSGEYDFLMFPNRMKGFSFNSVGIIDEVWRAKYQNKHKGAKNLLGMVQGWYDEVNNKIIIHFMSVRPSAKRNHINSFMVQYAKKVFESTDVIFHEPTAQGYSFIESEKFEEGGDLKENSKKHTYYIQERVKWGEKTWVIMERYPYLTGFAEEEYNGEIYTDENKAKSKLDLINLLNKDKHEEGGDLKNNFKVEVIYDLLAPNGKPSNLTPEQYKLVRSPEFIAWFGNWIEDPENSSKVVDSNGEPLVVFHVTDKDFFLFDNKKSKDGFYFSANKERLKAYNKKRILEVFLNIKNPSSDEFNKNGFDGIMDFGHSENKSANSLYEIVAFESNQIKLADGTNTTFDGSNPDTRFDMGGSIISKEIWNKWLKENTNERGIAEYESNDGTEFSFDYVNSIITISRKKYPKGLDMVIKKENYSTGELSKIFKVFDERVKELVFGNKSFKLSDNKQTLIEYENNPDIRFEDGGGVSFDKVISASTRFRPTETVVFDPPLEGKNGAKLISYTWSYEWTMTPNREGELKSKRISDWTQAEISADTGRDIVHQYTILMPDGEYKTVSSDSVPVLLGYLDKKELKLFPNLVTASKTLAKQQMQLAILEAHKKEYDELIAKFEKAEKPEIRIAKHEELPFAKYHKQEDGVVPSETYFIMEDVRYGQFNQDYYDPKEGTKYKLIDKPNRATIEQLTSQWVSKRVEENGGKYPRGLYDLKNRVARQKRKVENILNSKMENGGDVDSNDFDDYRDYDELSGTIVGEILDEKYYRYLDVFPQTQRFILSEDEEIKFMDKTQDAKYGFKPRGLWYAFGMDWFDAVQSVVPSYASRYNFIHTIKVTNKVCSIKTIEEAIEFTDKYGVGEGHFYKQYLIDWSKVEKDYSGVEALNPEKWCRTEGFEGKLWWMYSWDAASGCIWKSDGIESIEPYHYKEVYNKKMKEWEDHEEMMSREYDERIKTEQGSNADKKMFGGMIGSKRLGYNGKVFIGKDGNWRFEFSDHKAKLLIDVDKILDKTIVNIPLIHMIEHRELYKAYPELRDIKVVFKSKEDYFIDNPKMLGFKDEFGTFVASLAYNKSTDSEKQILIYTNHERANQIPTSEVYYLLLRCGIAEIQHAIQQTEGFGEEKGLQSFIEREQEKNGRDIKALWSKVIDSPEKSIERIQYQNEFNLFMNNIRDNARINYESQPLEIESVESIKRINMTKSQRDKNPSSIEKTPKMKDGGSMPSHYIKIVSKDGDYIGVMKFNPNNTRRVMSLADLASSSRKAGYKLIPIDSKKYDELVYNIDYEKLEKFQKDIDASDELGSDIHDLSFKKGGSLNLEDKDSIYKDWKELINMSYRELKSFYDSKEGKEAGLSKAEADDLGIHSGRESAKWIMKMKHTKRNDWTDNMWDWAKRQVSFVKRMSASKGDLIDEKGNKTRKYLSLLIWGHDPLKK